MLKRYPVEMSLAALLIICMILRLHLAFVYEINWDEFLNLSMVHDYSNGSLTEPLQTFFVHAFRWTPFVSGNEVDQVVAARGVMFVCATLTVVFLIAVSRKLMPLHAALFAALCYATYSFSVRQGGSFRTDTMATCVLMAAIWIIICRPQKAIWAVFSAGLIGLAGMLTIKAIFYAPSIAAILLIQIAKPGPKGPAFQYGAIVALSSVASFIAIFAAHWLSFEDPASALAFLDRTTGKTLAEHDSGVLYRYFVEGVLFNPAFWIALVAGGMACLWRLARGQDALNSAMLLCMALPLGSLLVYSESYPYFYSFLLAPVAVLCGAGLTTLPSKTARFLTLFGAIAVTAQFALTHADTLGRDNRAQHLTLEVVHQMFPEPTPYIDRSSMVSSFPKKGFFLSHWGMSDYYQTGVPVFEEVIRADQPRFVIANRRMLEFQNLVPERSGPEHFGFFEEDIMALRSNYIPHWGRVYVAGKEIEVTESGAAQSFEVLIEGHYTIEAAEAVLLNGQLAEPGTNVHLSAGGHQMSAATPGKVVLRWGKDLYRPEFSPPVGKLFNSF